MINTKKTIKSKIAFCITSMNRLSHVKETLEKNIIDNNLPEEVQFVLLDYNSSDGLEKWVKSLKKYFDSDILAYYRTNSPTEFLRSHSRNMSFRLANADIVCNLDADNYLGKGFAKYIVDKFDKNKEKDVFVTSNCSVRDTFGRFCVYKDDFMKIRGYNEALAGYGVEDLELFYRFIKSNYHQDFFEDPAFYKVISHPHEDRISQEYRYKNLQEAFISYISPYKTSFIILYKEYACESGILINNMLYYYNVYEAFPNLIERCFDEKYRIMLYEPLRNGKWIEKQDNIEININETSLLYKQNASQIEVDNTVFYKVKDKNTLSELIMHLSDAINYNKAKEELYNNNIKNVINPNGFGQGVVYKNFNYSNPIYLR